MMKIQNKILILLFLLSNALLAQDESLSIDFNGRDHLDLYRDYQITSEDNNLVLDFSELSSFRNVLDLKLDSRSVPRASFAVFTKIKTVQNISQNAVVLTNKASNGDDGWEIRVLEDGHWEWNFILGGKIQKSYSPKGDRLKLDDNKFHLVGFSYDFQKNQVWIYFDSDAVAVINLEKGNLSGFEMLKLGGDSKGEQNSIEAYYKSLYLFTKYVGPGRVLKLYNNNSSRYSGEDGVNGSFYPKFKVMTWNLNQGGKASGSRVGVKRSFGVIASSKADIIAIQEDNGSGATIANELSYYYYSISDKLSIISKFPFSQTIKIYHSSISGGVEIAISKNQYLYFFNVSLNEEPLANKYANDYSNPRFRQREEESRAKDLNEILKQIRVVLKPSSRTSLIMAGDLNSLSNVDDYGKMENYPVYSKFTIDNYLDSYRELYENTRVYKGFTVDKSDKLKSARLDYIFYKGSKLKALSSEVINHHPIKFPSDKFGVLSEFEWLK